MGLNPFCKVFLDRGVKGFFQLFQPFPPKCLGFLHSWVNYYYYFKFNVILWCHPWSEGQLVIAQKEGWTQTSLFTFSDQSQQSASLSYNCCFLSLIPLNRLAQPRSLCFLYTTVWQVYRLVIAAQCLWLHYKVYSCGHIWFNSVMTQSNLWETWEEQGGNVKCWLRSHCWSVTTRLLLINFHLCII